MQTYEEKSGKVCVVESVIGHMRIALLTPFYYVYIISSDYVQKEITY